MEIFRIRNTGNTEVTTGLNEIVSQAASKLTPEVTASILAYVTAKIIKIADEVASFNLEMEDRYVEPEEVTEKHEELRGRHNREACRLRCLLAQTHPEYNSMEVDLKNMGIARSGIFITALQNHLIEYFGGPEEYKCYFKKRAGQIQVAIPHQNFAGSDISWGGNPRISISM